MSKLSKALQAAAGNKPSDAIQGVSFDGSTDRLQGSNTADYFTTITVSLWFYVDTSITGNYEPLLVKQFTSQYSNYNNLEIYCQGDKVWVRIYNNNGGRTQVLSQSLNVAYGAWNHLIFSGDAYNNLQLTYSLNDAAPNVWNLSGDPLGFGDLWRVARSTGSATASVNKSGRCRLANVYVSYTAVDLSDVNVRRNFITADGTAPTGTDLANYNSPIIYLPLNDYQDAGRNLGSLADFTVDGVPDTAQRGAGQDNCVASQFTSVSTSGRLLAFPINTSFSDGKQFTFSGIFQDYSVDGDHSFFSAYTKLTFRLDAGSGADIRVQAQAPNTTTKVLEFSIPQSVVPTRANISLQISIDLSSTATRHVIVDGYDVTNDVSWITYNNSNIGFSNVDRYEIGGDSQANQCSQGEIFFDTTYMDLTTSNPFIDADTNVPKPLYAVLDDAGLTPPVAYPLRAGQGGTVATNLGTDVDFNTINAVVGVKGRSEYQSKSLDISQTSARYLTSGTKDFTSTTTFSFSGWIYNDSNTYSIFFSTNTNQDHTWLGVFDQSSVWRLTYRVANSTGYSTASIAPNQWYHILFTWQFPNNPRAWINGSETNWMNQSAPAYTTGLNTTTGPMIIGGDNVNYRLWNGDISEFYFTDQFIDFSQRVNRNYFLSNLDYSKDLRPYIDDGSIPNPIFYTSFNDRSDIGANYGTGGAFTPAGTIPRGRDVYRET